LQANDAGNKVATIALLFYLFNMPDGEAVQHMPVFAGTAKTNTDVEHRPELDLIERVRHGDEQAFGELYRIYAPTINAVVLARVPRDEVQDIVQEVFIAAYKNLGSLRDDSVFGPWIVKIARNRAAEFYRRSRNTEELSDDLARPNDRKNEAAEVLRAIRSLNEAYSETLILRLVEGMSGKEIAERTGLSHDSVRVNLHRGMEMLRQRLGIKGVKQ
jgi:RNA polymerase sigma-70 factor (ECF subfamily)